MRRVVLVAAAILSGGSAFVAHAKWGGVGRRYFALARPDQRGRFASGPLAPGDYLAIALEYVDENEAEDPDLLLRLSERATPLTIGDSETKTIVLSLVK